MSALSTATATWQATRFMKASSPLGDAARDEAAESHGAEAALRGREWDEREGADALVAEALHELRDSALLRQCR